MSQTPIIDTLKEYSKRKRTSFSMPGHKGGNGLNKTFKRNIADYDVTELEDTLNLHNPNNPIKEAKRLAAEFFGAGDTYFLVGGSTSGIFSMLAATASYGDTVIVNRASHQAVINACIILGLKPVYIPQNVIDGFSVPAGINQTDLIKIIDDNPDAKAVLITSPSYYGTCSDIETISKITRARGIPLLVDEAHGAHFAVNQNLFPNTALSQGADLVVQSAHKTLNAMNQAAYLHVSGDIVNRKRLEKVLAMYQTSSPSYPIIATADMARAELDSKSGRNAWRVVYDNCERFRNNISSKTDVEFISTMLNGKYNINSVDETRIVMNFSAYKITGFEIAKRLRENYNIDVEMADLFNVVAIATPANTAKDFIKLTNAILKICRELEKSEEEPVFPAVPIPDMGMTPQEAFYAKSKKVRLEEAVGAISATTVLAYPPAVPIVCVGEYLTEESIAYIQALQEIGAEIIGLDGTMYISVVEK